MYRPLTTAAVMLFSSGIALADSAIEDGFAEQVEFRHEDVATEATNDKFGAHVATVPGYAIVSAPQAAGQVGVVYLFRLDAADIPAGSFVKTLPRFGDVLSVSRQGLALAGHGDWFAVGQGREPAVTLYRRNQGGPNNWGLARTVQPPDDPTYREVSFPGSFSEYPTIDLHGDLLIASDYQGDLFDATGTTLLEDDAGFAFIYERNAGGPDNWGLIARLEDPSQDLNDDEEFGRAVGIYDGLDGDIAVIGAPSTDVDGIGNDVGEAFVFTRAPAGGGWTLAKTLLGEGMDGRQASDQFGRSVDVDRQTIVVGTNNGGNVGSNSGSAHIYYRDRGGANNWGEVTEILIADGLDNFSRSLQVRDDRVIVGAPNAGPGGRGQVFIYERDEGGIDNWGLEQDLSASATESNDEFGSGVSIIDGFVVVGDRGRDSRDGSASRTGSAYVFLDDLIFCDNFETDEPAE